MIRYQGSDHAAGRQKTAATRSRAHHVDARVRGGLTTGKAPSFMDRVRIGHAGRAPRGNPSNRTRLIATMTCVDAAPRHRGQDQVDAIAGRRPCLRRTWKPSFGDDVEGADSGLDRGTFSTEGKALMLIACGNRQDRR